MVLFHQCVISPSHLVEKKIQDQKHQDSEDCEVDEEELIYTKASISYFTSECVVYIFDKLNFYEDRPSLVLKFLEIVEKISAYPNIAENLMDHEAVKVLVDQMNYHCKHSMVQVVAINAVDNLQKFPSEGSSCFSLLF